MLILPLPGPGRENPHLKVVHMIGLSGCLIFSGNIPQFQNVHVTFLKRYRIRLLIFKLKCQYIHIAQMIIKGIDKLTIKNCFYIYWYCEWKWSKNVYDYSRSTKQYQNSNYEYNTFLSGRYICLRFYLASDSIALAFIFARGCASDF